jgi:Mrp family chromosome partitioning ATPase
MVQNTTNEFQILLKALSYFRTHWWLFALEVFFIYGVSLVKFYRTDPVYESTGSLLIDSSRRQLYQSVMMPGVPLISNARKQNMAHLLQSQEAMERFRTQFTDYYNSEGRPSFLRPFFPGGVAPGVDAYRNWMALNWDRNSDIYNMRCVATTPQAAHGLCLVYMNTIQAYYPEVGQRDVMMKRDFLSRQISSLTRQLAEREFNLTDFQKKNEDFINFIMLNIEGKGLQRLRAQAIDLRQKINTNRALKQLILNVPRAKRGEHTVQDASIAALTARISELQYQLTLQRQSGSPEKEDRIRGIEGEIRRQEAALAKLNEEEEMAYLRNPIDSLEVRKRLSSLELEFRTDSIKLRDIEAEITNIQMKEKKYQQQRLEYDRLQAELIHKRKLLANLFQKEQETELELSAGNAEIFRLQEPTQRGIRIEPQLSKHLYAALSLSIFALVATTILLIALVPRLDSEAEVHRLNLPVLGKIPLMRRTTSTMDELPSFGLEYLKIMNYRILRETKDLKCPIVVISSPHSREGKSTVTSYLSLASQTPGRKTLLIDGDLITSHPNQFFGFQEDHTPGARAVLEEPERAASKSIVVKTVHEGVSFMPRGGRIEPIALPNYLKPMELYLDQLRREYDIIFIDTPPLFASNLAHQWAGLADLIVLVARIYFTRPKDIVEALQTCKVFSKAPVGVALNCLPLSAQQKRASNYYFSRGKSRPTKLAA